MSKVYIGIDGDMSAHIFSKEPIWLNTDSKYVYSDGKKSRGIRSELTLMSASLLLDINTEDLKPAMIYEVQLIQRIVTVMSYGINSLPRN